MLDSAEFYDVEKNEWTKVSGLKIPRTEHTMSLIYGIPTVIGETEDCNKTPTFIEFPWARSV